VKIKRNIVNGHGLSVLPSRSNETPFEIKRRSRGSTASFASCLCFLQAACTPKEIATLGKVNSPVVD